MSIYSPQTKNPFSGEFDVAPGVIFTAEGQAIARTSTNQAAGVHPSTGQATDIFQGFAVANTVGAAFAEPFANIVRTYVVPAGGVIVLDRTPVAGQVGVYDNTAGAPVVAPTLTVTGATLSGLTVGNTVTVTYKYLLSVIDRVSQFGNEQPGGFVGNIVGQIGFIAKGSVFTSEFDASVDWRAATAVKMEANGQVTDQTGTGVVIPNCTVIAVPGVQVPYLGLFLS